MGYRVLAWLSQVVAPYQHATRSRGDNPCQIHSESHITGIAKGPLQRYAVNARTGPKQNPRGDIDHAPTSRGLSFFIVSNKKNQRFLHLATLGKKSSKSQ
jgi:hypothetical protein